MTTDSGEQTYATKNTICLNKTNVVIFTTLHCNVITIKDIIGLVFAPLISQLLVFAYSERKPFTISHAVHR